MRAAQRRAEEPGNQIGPGDDARCAAAGWGAGQSDRARWRCSPRRGAASCCGL